MTVGAGCDGAVHSYGLLGIRRIIKDLRTPKNKCKNRSIPVDTLNITDYGICMTTKHYVLYKATSNKYNNLAARGMSDEQIFTAAASAGTSPLAISREEADATSARWMADGSLHVWVREQMFDAAADAKYVASVARRTPGHSFGFAGNVKDAR